MEGLVKRGGVWVFRRRVPDRLRSVIGKNEVRRSLKTGDERVAMSRWASVKADVDRIFAEAENGVSPTVAGYRAVEQWRSDATGSENDLDLHLTSLLDPHWKGTLTPTQRAQVEALLKRTDHAGADNPPLSVIFDRYFIDRKPGPKTRLEWTGALARFTSAVGDLSVREITPAHVRELKGRLLATKGRTGATLSPATVKKTLGALASVLSWAHSEQYVISNPALGITARSGGNGGNEEARRLPYSAADLTKIFAVKREGDANYWLPYLALYTGARLEELGQLRTADVRNEEGVDYLDIAPGDGKRVKTRSSKRRVPVHPALVRLGFLAFVERQREAGEAQLFPELKATKFSRTAAWSKWWGRHARTVCGITDPRKVMHSFRHLWKDAARGVMPEEHHDSITGHSNGSVGRSYGMGVPLKVLAESLARVRFAGMED